MNKCRTVHKLFNCLYSPYSGTCPNMYFGLKILPTVSHCSIKTLFSTTFLRIRRVSLPIWTVFSTPFSEVKESPGSKPTLQWINTFNPHIIHGNRYCRIINILGYELWPYGDRRDIQEHFLVILSTDDGFRWSHADNEPEHPALQSWCWKKTIVKCNFRYYI